jgi:hypothetical protein
MTTAIRFQTPPGQNYSQASAFDPQQVAIIDECRLALCQDRDFQQILKASGMGHLRPDQIGVAADVKNVGDDPTLFVWPIGTGNKLPIPPEYQNDFMAEFAEYLAFENALPPTLPKPQQAPRPTPTPAVPTQRPTPAIPTPQGQPAFTPTPASTSAMISMPGTTLEHILASHQDQLKTIQSIFTHSLASRDQLTRELHHSNQQLMWNLQQQSNGYHAQSEQRFMQNMNQSEQRFMYNMGQMAQFTRDMQREQAQLREQSEQRFMYTMNQSDQRHMHYTGQMAQFMRDMSQQNAQVQVNFNQTLRDQQSHYNTMRTEFVQLQSDADANNRAIQQDLIRLIRDQGRALVNPPHPNYLNFPAPAPAAPQQQQADLPRANSIRHRQPGNGFFLPVNHRP